MDLSYPINGLANTQFGKRFIESWLWHVISNRDPSIPSTRNQGNKDLQRNRGRRDKNNERGSLLVLTMEGLAWKEVGAKGLREERDTRRKFLTSKVPSDIWCRRGTMVKAWVNSSWKMILLLWPAFNYTTGDSRLFLDLLSVNCKSLQDFIEGSVNIRRTRGEKLYIEEWEVWGGR